jgi:two-component system response regulator YesN
LYNVLLVDDEPTIREGLRTLIPWEDYGYQVVDTATNAKDAIRKHESIRPNLMIVDIRMPGMDGLELIEALRETDSDLHVLILSGYADFNYAKKAITNRIDGYLLKPVDEDELISYLEKLKGNLDEEKRRSVRREAAVEETKEQIVQRLLSGNPGDDENELGKHGGPGWASYEMLLLKLQSKDEIEADTEQTFKKSLVRHFDEMDRGIVFSMPPYIGVLLKQPLTNDAARETAYGTVARVSEEYGTDFIAVSGGEAGAWEEIGTTYANALTLMKERFFLPADSIVRFGDLEASLIEKQAGDEPEFDTQDIVEKLFLAVDIGNANAVEQLIEEAGARMRKAGLPEQAIKTHTVQIAAAVLGKLSMRRPEIQAHSQQFSINLLEIYKEYRYRDLLRHSADWFLRLAGVLEDQGTETIVKKMIDLIRRNYHENLKLETLAEVFHYNSAYLGKVFKSSTGEYFNTYLDKVRIEHAKELLEQGMKVYQVAGRIGYANVDYFHGKFRKYVGTSPSAYRKKE